MKVLIIEDDINIINVLKIAFELGWPDISIISAQSGAKGLTMVDTESPDAVILDLGLPDINGLEILRQIRLFSVVPVLILTVRDDESSVVTALSHGANDFLTKPFRQMELLARIKAMTRWGQTINHSNNLDVGSWQLSSSLTELRQNNRTIHLTYTEGLLLSLLMKNSGHFVSKEILARQTWHKQLGDIGDSLRIYIKRLRDKIEEHPQDPRIIINKPRQGYMFVC
ncbi:DNA-binding response regulator [Dehalogenimonas sp. WBC-2]|nr:DNA-binding response regulator [Dehalogenimonas sp. WBC-2]